MTSQATKVKICGLRNLDDALAAAQAGADYLGLVFVYGRRRRVTADEAKTISEGVKNSGGPVPKIVGLFADQLLDEVNALVEYCSLDAAQLCGQEPVEYASKVDSQVIKVVHVPESATAANDAGAGSKAKEYSQAGHMVTLDRLVEGLQGGTGEGFDWNVAALLAKSGQNFLLAGGLTPDNVADAIKTVHPWGVDVSSGVETYGDKDQGKIRDFLRNARAAGK